MTRPKWCSGCPEASKEECARCYKDFEKDIAKINLEEFMKIKIEEVNNGKTN